ncbi:hypothetical protein, partial [Actinomadura harenae]
MTRVADVAALLNGADVCGVGDAAVRHVLLAVDACATTVAEAERLGAGMLVTLGGTVTAHLGYRLGAAGIASCVVPPSGGDECSEAVAARLGLVDARPLLPRDEALDTVVAFVPKPDVEYVIDALAEAGAGAIGDYARCVWTAEGVGSFVPLDGARPVIGAVGEVEAVAETRVEMVLPRARRAEVAAALRAAHPYEE